MTPNVYLCLPSTPSRSIHSQTYRSIDPLFPPAQNPTWRFCKHQLQHWPASFALTQFPVLRRWGRVELYTQAVELAGCCIWDFGPRYTQLQPVPTWVLACCNCCQCEKEKEPTMSKHIRVFHIWDFVPGPPTDKLAPTKVLPTEESIWYPGQCHQCSIRHRTQQRG